MPASSAATDAPASPVHTRQRTADGNIPLLLAPVEGLPLTDEDLTQLALYESYTGEVNSAGVDLPPRGTHHQTIKADVRRIDAISAIMPGEAADMKRMVEAVEEEPRSRGTVFTGEGDYAAWKHTTALHLLYSDHDDAAKVRYIMRRVQGAAALCFKITEVITSPQVVWDRLDARYGDELSLVDADAKMSALYQGSSTLKAYTEEFNRLAAILDLGEEAAIGRHAAHTGKYLKVAAMTAAGASTFSGYYASLRRVDGVLWRERESKDSKKTVSSTDNKSKRKFPGKEMREDGETRVCYNCGKAGHLRNACRSKKEPAKKASEKASTKAEVEAEESENE